MFCPLILTQKTFMLSQKNPRRRRADVAGAVRLPYVRDAEECARELESVQLRARHLKFPVVGRRFIPVEIEQAVEEPPSKCEIHQTKGLRHVADLCEDRVFAVPRRANTRDTAEFMDGDRFAEQWRHIVRHEHRVMSYVPDARRQARFKVPRQNADGAKPPVIPERLRKQSCLQYTPHEIHC